MATANRLSIHFNLEDKDQEAAIKFLDKCGYKKNKIIAIMVSEFMAKYELDIEKLNPGEMKEFISGYEYIKQNHTPMQIYPTVAIQAPKSDENKETKKDTKISISAPREANNGAVKASAMDMDKANLALSGFGL